MYLDDILISSKSPAEHRIHVRRVLQRLLENRLFIKAEKCKFHVSSVSFLSYIFQDRQVKTDPEKIQAMAEWPNPTNRKQLQRFLGYANFYRCFICNYSTIALPLTRLTSIKIPFLWSPEAAQAFELLKERFTTAPILSQPN